MLTPAKLIMLEEAAAAAIGRPERRCQVAMADIYKQAGLLPMNLVIPSGDLDWARTQGRSLITPWIEASGRWEEVSGIAIPGDLLGFRLGRTLHHVAILLSGGRMVHVFGAHGVQVAPCIPEAWAKRLEKVWRPVTS